MTTQQEKTHEETSEKSHGKTGNEVEARKREGEAGNREGKAGNSEVKACDREGTAGNGEENRQAEKQR